MMGVFVSLDLFLYYGFWELSLVPMAILIAMFGRTDGTAAQRVKFFLYTFIPSALLLVGILWLYAKTGTFDFAQLPHAQTRTSIAMSPRRPVLGRAGLPVRLCGEGSGLPAPRLAGRRVLEAPTALAMVRRRQDGLYSMLRFSFGLFPAQARAHAPLDDRARGHRHSVWRMRRAGAERPEAAGLPSRRWAISVLSSSASSAFTMPGLDGAYLPDPERGLVGGALFMLLGLLYRALRHLRYARLWRRWRRSCPGWSPSSSSPRSPWSGCPC